MEDRQSVCVSKKMKQKTKQNKKRHSVFSRTISNIHPVGSHVWPMCHSLGLQCWSWKRSVRWMSSGECILSGRLTNTRKVEKPAWLCTRCWFDWQSAVWWTQTVSTVAAFPLKTVWDAERDNDFRKRQEVNVADWFDGSLTRLDDRL